MNKLNNKGMTIIEVLIASLVFTSILLLCMEGITRIAKVYVKNASVASSNEFAKSFIEDIAQQIKYGSKSPSAIYDGTISEWRICVGDNAYKIAINRLSNDSIKKKSAPGCVVSTITPATFFDDAANIAPNRSRVLDFNISPSSPYVISIRIALGENDLLSDDSGKTPGDIGVVLSQVKCRPGVSGSEFCAVIPLTTTVTRRMITN